MHLTETTASDTHSTVSSLSKVSPHYPRICSLLHRTKQDSCLSIAICMRFTSLHPLSSVCWEYCEHSGFFDFSSVCWTNRERKRTSADLEDKIRERRWSNVSPLGLHQWNKIRGALWSYSTDEALVAKRLTIFVLLSCPLNLRLSFFVLCCCLK